MSNAVHSSQSAAAHHATAFAALRAPFDRIAGASGEAFFRVLVQELAEAMGTNHAYVSEWVAPDRIRTVAHWSRGKFADGVECAASDSPIASIVDDGACQFTSGVSQRFPALAGIESYVGAPLKAHDGTVLGHLCAFDERPMPADPQKLLMFQIVEARASAELDRLRYETKLRESEERFRDLFDEAPIAYVHEGLDTKFIRANRTAQRILGISRGLRRHVVYPGHAGRAAPRARSVRVGRQRHRYQRGGARAAAPQRRQASVHSIVVAT